MDDPQAESVGLHLRILCTQREQVSVSQALVELGCCALEERPDGSVLAYGDSEAELDVFASAMSELLGRNDVVQRVFHGDQWKLAFVASLEPIKLTEALWLAPTHRPLPEVPLGVHRLLLEPAFAFGHGEHPTTRLIGAWLDEGVRARPRAKVLDFGCGTGVLALAALCFGAERAVGLDIDEPSVEAARRNAELNGFQARCGFSCDSLASQDRDFDVVVANVDIVTLVENARAIATRMSDRGLLCLTGFLRERFGEISQAFAENAVRLQEVAHDDGWALVSNWPARG